MNTMNKWMNKEARTEKFGPAAAAAENLTDALEALEAQGIHPSRDKDNGRDRYSGGYESYTFKVGSTLYRFGKGWGRCSTQLSFFEDVYPS